MPGKVVIAGAGPTGMTLACELRLAGVDVVVLDRLAARAEESRANALQIRTMEVFDQRGFLEPFLREGKRLPSAHFSGLHFPMGHYPTRYPYSLLIRQSRVERLIEARALELGVRVRWSSEVTGLEQDDKRVAVELANGEWIEADYLVGCDGPRSAVRRLAGIGFPGTPSTLTALLGDVQLDDPPDGQPIMEQREHGNITVLAHPGFSRVVTVEYDGAPDRSTPVDLADLRRAAIRIAGTDFGMRDPQWLSRFGDAARLAESYRERRALLAGDAAHIHFPAGGQGLNVGVQDAVNLGWKLAAVINGHAPDALLDTYHAERHPGGATARGKHARAGCPRAPGPAVDGVARPVQPPDGHGRAGHPAARRDDDSARRPVSAWRRPPAGRRPRARRGPEYGRWAAQAVHIAAHRPSGPARPERRVGAPAGHGLVEPGRPRRGCA